MSPPGPRGPALWQTLRWAWHPVSFLRACEQEFGDFFQVRLVGGRRYAVLANPEAVREVLAAHQTVGNHELRPFFGDHSLLLSSGDEHLHHRRVLSRVFGMKTRAEYGEDALELARHVLSGWQVGEARAIYPHLQYITLRIILRALFGFRAGEALEQFCQVLGRAMDRINGFILFFSILQRDMGPLTPGRKVQQIKRELDAMLYAVIRERSESLSCGPPACALDAMLAESGTAFSLEQIRDQLVTLLFAGHEPTTSALASTLYWIKRAGDVEHRLEPEIEQFRSNPSVALVTDGLPYLDAVCREALRIHPVVAVIERVSSEPVELLGCTVPPGVRLSPCVYLLHHRADVFPEPERFRPERFLERTFEPHEYIPFGGGTRRCIGMHFALIQIKAILAGLLSQVRFDIPNLDAVRLAQRGATLGPSENMRFRVLERYQARPQITSHARTNEQCW